MMSFSRQPHCAADIDDGRCYADTSERRISLTITGLPLRRHAGISDEVEPPHAIAGISFCRHHLLATRETLAISRSMRASPITPLTAAATAWVSRHQAAKRRAKRPIAPRRPLMPVTSLRPRFQYVSPESLSVMMPIRRRAVNSETMTPRMRCLLVAVMFGCKISGMAIPHGPPKAISIYFEESQERAL